MQIRYLLLPPVPHGKGSHILGGQRQVGGDAEEHIRGEYVDGRFDEAHIAVGRLDEDLRLLVFEHPLFQKFQFPVQLGAAGRQVAVEAEVLPVEARSHQGEQDGRRAHQRHDLDAPLVRGLHHKGAGVGHAGAAGFGEQADVLALFGIFQEAGALFGRGVLGDLVEGEFAEGLRRVGLFDEAPGGFGALGDENIQAVEDVDNILWEGVGCVFAQGRGDEV